MPLVPNDGNEIPKAGGDVIPFINRTPVRKDPGNAYFVYSKGGSTVALWVRHPDSGNFAQV